MSSRKPVIRNRWENVQIHQDRKKLFSKCTLSLVSHFLSVRPQGIRNTNHFFIFLPDFTPTADDSAANKIMIFSVTHSEIRYTFTFESEEQVEAFDEAMNRAITIIHDIIATPESYNDHFSLDVEGIIPGVSSPKRYSLTVDPVLNQIQIIGADHKVIDLEIRKTWCSCLASQYKNFKKSAKTQWSFIMRKDDQKDDYVFVANGEQEMMQVVMMVYIHSFRVVRAINLMKAKPVVSKSAAEIQIVDVVETASEVCTQPEEQPVQVPVEEESKVEFVKKERLKITRPANDYHIPAVQHEEIVRPSFLKGKKNDRCKERYIQLCQTLKTLYEPTPAEKPNIAALIGSQKLKRDLQPENSASLLEKVISLIPDIHITGPYRNFEARSTAEIIRSASETIVPSNVKPSTLVNTADFRDINFAKWENIDEPEVPFIEFLTNTCQTIIETKTIIYGNDTECTCVVLIVVALLVNGMIQKGDFLEAFTTIAEHVPGLTRTIEAASTETEPWNRISIFTIKLLNEEGVIPVLKRMRCDESWMKRYYTNTGLIFSREFETAVDILTTVLPRVKFMIPINPEFVMKATTHGDFISRYIQTTMFSHLAIQRVLKPDFTVNQNDLELYLTFQMTSLLTYELTIENIKNPGGPTFRFIMKVAESRILPENKDWQEFCNYVRAIAVPLAQSEKETRVQRLIRAGIACNKIHLWFFFLATAPHIAEKFFYPESPFRDAYRARYIVNILAAITK